MQQVNGSEVVRLKQQIEAERVSAQRAQSSFAYGSAQHKFITRRLERMGELHEQLKRANEKEAGKFLMGLQ